MTTPEIEELKPSIPTVKPPISFPSLPEHVEIPEDPEKPQPRNPLLSARAQQDQA